MPAAFPPLWGAFRTERHPSSRVSQLHGASSKTLGVLRSPDGLDLPAQRLLRAFDREFERILQSPTGIAMAPYDWRNCVVEFYL